MFGDDILTRVVLVHLYFSSHNFYSFTQIAIWSHQPSTIPYILILLQNHPLNHQFLHYSTLTWLPKNNLRFLRERESKTYRVTLLFVGLDKINHTLLKFSDLNQTLDGKIKVKMESRKESPNQLQGSSMEIDYSPFIHKCRVQAKTLTMARFSDFWEEKGKKVPMEAIDGH